MPAVRPAQVAIVAPPTDMHAESVISHLAAMGIPLLQISAHHLAEQTLLWRPDGDLRFRASGQWWSINGNTAVWWRRPSRMWDTSIADDADRALAADEASAIFDGALVSVVRHWIDSPDVTRRAESKLCQLRVAHALQLTMPDTLVTNDVAEARDFVGDGNTVAKCTSIGPGLAPYVDCVTHDLVDLVQASPVLLQRLVAGGEDVRVVTIGRDVVGWSRSRLDLVGPDWRREDPAGNGFAPCELPTNLAADADAMARALGLHFSVQDWITVGNDSYFLEVNPQGQWLFLSDAARIVSPLLAAMLSGFA